MKECPACKLCFTDDVLRCPNDNEQTLHTLAGEPVLDSRYQLIKRLGQGGMGVVYRARHSYLKTSHAVKVILPDLVGNDPNLVTRFRQEALAAAAIRHRNIVNVTDFGVVAGKMPFLVMEYVDGEALHDLLLREKRLAPHKALEILSAVCSGLAEAHKQQIVHRDLKPLNIMIASGAPIEEAVKILDFGLAKIRSGELLGSFVQAQTTGLMGSPYYMAPEQWSDDEPDVRADVYSLGVILYQMLAGEVPFKGNSIPSIMRKHLTDAPPPFTDFGLNLPPAIEEAVFHALEKNADKRTESVELLTKEFRRALEISTADLSAAASRFEQTVKESTLRQKQKATALMSKTFAAPGEPATTLRVKTTPPESFVFLDGEQLGISESNGWLVAEQISRGKHVMRVVKDGHTAVETELVCDRDICHTSAELQSLAETSLPTQISPGALARNNVSQETVLPANNSNAPLAATEMNLGASAAGQEQNAQPLAAKSSANASQPDVRRDSFHTNSKISPTTGGVSMNNVPEMNQSIPQVDFERKSGLNIPILVGAFVIGFVLIVAGGFTAYKVLFAPPAQQQTDNPPVTNPGSQNPTNSPPNPGASKIEMISIPGGSFTKGTDTGQEFARPAHKVAVQTFQITKFEITNRQYAEFVSEARHEPPPNWINGKYLPEEENFPVTTVSVNDATAFARWRSEKDGVQYDLPTEDQWEYAARNGERNNVYPWGNDWQENRAVMGKYAAQAVGSFPPGANMWGVQDLIGNVWEWTKTPFAAYPGSKLQIRAGGMAARGGSFQKPPDDVPVTSVYRNAFVPTTRDPRIGFRLISN